MKTYKVACEGEHHHLGLDDYKKLHLLNHDIEEEETLLHLGDYTSTCYRIMQELLSDPNKALESAHFQNSVELIKLAVSFGATDPAQRPSCVDWAILVSSPAILEYLISTGVNVLESTYALPWAAEQGNTPIVKLLLNAGCNVNTPSNEPPLKRAFLNQQFGIIPLLIDAGADPSVLLSMEIEMLKRDYPDIRAALKRNASYNDKNL